MKAGRELDALVAEKVMGESWCQLMKDGEATSETGPRKCLCGAIGYPYEHHRPYSTDIAAAWEVVEKIGLFTDKQLVLAHDGQNWIICEEVTPAGCQMILASADTAPLAICLAALNACGVDI